MSKLVAQRHYLHSFELFCTIPDTRLSGAAPLTPLSPLPRHLVQKQRSGHADVEGLDLSSERDGDRAVACAPDERSHALALGAEDERQAAVELGLPQRFLRVG